jgi:type II secretory pathway component PulK
MTVKLNRYVLILVLVAGAAYMCRSEELSTPGLLKQADVKRLLKSAQTREEYAQLAAYFEDRSKEFELKAREEDKELDRLSNATFRAKNYPILVDRARNSGDYDRSEAKKCAEQALAFHQKAEGAATDQSAGAAKQYE